MQLENEEKAIGIGVLLAGEIIDQLDKPILFGQSCLALKAILIVLQKRYEFLIDYTFADGDTKFKNVREEIIKNMEDLVQQTIERCNQ